MRATTRLFLLGTVTSAIAGAIVFAGCGGSSDNGGGGTPDAGRDVAPQEDHWVAPVDAGIDAPKGPVDAGCVAPDADLTMIGVPDADINDAGASTGKCLECIHTSCPSYLSACNADCFCKAPIVNFLTCVQDPDAGLAQCAGGLLGADKTAQDLLFCTYTGCQQECGLPSFEAGAPDGATMTDAAPADAAPADAAAE